MAPKATPANPQAALQAFQAEVADTFAKNSGITVAQARSDLAFQSQAVALEKRLGSSLATASIDDTAQHLTLEIAPGTSGASVRTAISSSGLLGSQVTVTNVPYTAAQLTSELWRLCCFRGSVEG